MIEKLGELANCEMHVTHMPTPGDEAGLRNLGINLTSEPNFASRELVSLTAMLAVSEPFYRGESGWDSSQVAARLDLPPRLAHDILQQLVRLGFLSEVKDGLHDRDAYQPGRALDVLTVHDLLQGLKQDGINYSRLRNTPEREVVREIEEMITTAGRRALAEMSLQDLVKKMLVKREAQRDQVLSGEKVSSEKAPFSKTA